VVRREERADGEEEREKKIFPKTRREKENGK
jgi:hypothetical protein